MALGGRVNIGTNPFGPDRDVEVGVSAAGVVVNLFGHFWRVSRAWRWRWVLGFWFWDWECGGMEEEESRAGLLYKS